MASTQDVSIISTPKGVRVSLDKLYLYPDGHATHTFAPIPEVGFKGINSPLTNCVDALVELSALVKRAQDEIVEGRPTKES